MRYTLTGACPRCGAPIYETRTAEDFTDAPGAHFTCECRTTFPTITPDTPDDEAHESVDDADKKFLARNRTRKPGEEEGGE